MCSLFEIYVVMPLLNDEAHMTFTKKESGKIGNSVKFIKALFMAFIGGF